MKTFNILSAAILLLVASACCQNQAQSSGNNSDAVIENIMARRSIRKYKPTPVGRDTMNVILECGINAPNGQNRQSWEVRVVDSPALMDEIKEAMALGMEYAKKYNADLLLATDPDCDRVGVAAKEADGAYRLLTGNEVGILLCDYLCKQKLESGSMPHSPVAIKTIVTSELAERVLNSYGVEVVNLLTGFKYIGEYVGSLEERGEIDRFIFGFEESCGYLNGAYVRDKDGVAASLLVSKMAAQLKATGGSLLKALAQIYEKYGYEKCLLRSYTFEGVRGAKRIADAMRVARKKDLCFDSFSVRERVDYSLGISDLPKTDAIKFILDRGSVILRPSGTEPKLKMYVCGISTDEKSSECAAREIADCVESALGLS